jgi:hypothetical protein
LRRTCRPKLSADEISLDRSALQGIFECNLGGYKLGDGLFEVRVALAIGAEARKAVFERTASILALERR